MAETLDRGWLAANPLPPTRATDKNGRGRLLLLGGSARAPGAVLLAGRAAFRAGVGKVQLGTIAAACPALGMALPEAAILALPASDEGHMRAEAIELIREDLGHADAVVFGPGIFDRPDHCTLLTQMLAVIGRSTPLLLDAGAIAAFGRMAPAEREDISPIVITPHPGELSRLTGWPEREIARDLEAAAEAAASQFGVTVVLKSKRTVIAGCDAETILHDHDVDGLGVAGSGDVLAGAIGGLLAQGLAPRAAAGWGVWAHAASGRQLQDRIGPIGYTASEIGDGLAAALNGARSAAGE